jgi:hypothetical protein
MVSLNIWTIRPTCVLPQTLASETTLVQRTIYQEIDTLQEYANNGYKTYHRKTLSL